MAVDDDYDLDEDTALNVSAPGVLDNDSDPDGDTLTATVNTGPSSGTVTLNGDGSFIYTPNANFNGSDSFTYDASDDNGGTATATVNLTVNAVNDPPQAFGLLEPPNGTEVDTLNPTLVWEPGQEVDPGDSSNYEVIISTQSDFSDTVLVAITSDTTFTVPDGLQPAQDYYWKVTCIDTSGARTESGSAFMFRTADTATDVESGHSDFVPDEFALFQNYPNPFNPETLITYQLPRNAEVELTIYNLTGQQVRLLVNEAQSVGTHEIRWNGTDDSGNRVSSGVYVYRLRTGDFSQSNKMLLMR